MSFLPITNKFEAREAFEQFREQFSREALLFSDHWVGHRGATKRYDVYWHRDKGIWGLFDDREDRGRFWICFGTQDPQDSSSLSITVEVNPPFEGINRHCAGIFLCDAGGVVYVAHSGKVGGGRKGIGQSAFRDFVGNYGWEAVRWPDGRQGAFKVLSRLDSPELTSRVAEFVHDVGKFKEHAMTDKARSLVVGKAPTGQLTDRPESRSNIGKYQKLCHHLANLNGEEWRASFEDIEEILGRKLPRSARQYAAWWSNGRSESHAMAWLRAGWRTSDLNLTGETVRFQRAGHSTLEVARTDGSASSQSRNLGSLKATSEKIAKDTEGTEKVQVCNLRYAWVPAGLVQLDSNEKLLFPEVASVPGLYRFQLIDGSRRQVYIGEADNLKKRFGFYRNAGASQATNIRLNELFTRLLKNGQQVSVLTITDTAWISTHGLDRRADLGFKAERVLLEHAAIVYEKAEGLELLNK